MTDVWCQQWEESERGWGVRPDGYSLHATEDDVAAFTVAYWATMPNAAPPEYSRPCGKPYPVAADDEVLAKLNDRSEYPHGLRMFSNEDRPEPPDSASDVWRHRGNTGGCG